MLDITDKEFESIQKITYSRIGVNLRPTKKPLILSRLRKRLEDLNFSTFTPYIALLEKSGSEELEIFINAVTTNETYFFRHTGQFNYLYEQILPSLIAKDQKKVTVWSGASSTGEEPYSLAIALIEFAKKNRGFTFELSASDINTEVLEEAKEGIYDPRSLKEVPQSLVDKYFTKQSTKHGERFAISSEVKSRVEFFQHNLLTPSYKRNVDIIFLRNVLIYFDRQVKENVVNLLEPCLVKGGHFFISYSENLNDIKSSLELIGHGIFIKK
ncbi:MAG: hypothetical protein JNN05_08270 [Candidatus Omnitrophica bacterium]|nr:hypothetical protein [Candidatus Omnitrophota bacterium]